FVERVQYLLAQNIHLESTPMRSASGASIPERSIAVLPFTNHARTPELDTLARCMTEDLASQLARTPGFQVVAQPAGAAARARYVISGSVRQHEPGCVRVAIQII